MALRLRGAKQLFWRKLKVSSSMTGSDALDPSWLSRHRHPLVGATVEVVT